MEQMDNSIATPSLAIASIATFDKALGGEIHPFSL